MQNQYFYIIAVALLLLFLVYQEIKRPNRKRLGWRIAATLIASASLLFLILPLKYHDERTINAKVIDFLTTGSESMSLGESAYFTSDSTLLRLNEKAQVTYIPDLLYYLSVHPEISGVHVFGYGLSETELQRLKNTHVKFSPAPLPGGVLTCSWPSIVPASERVMVEGMYYNNTNKVVKLSLVGMGSQQDSVSIPGNATRPFRLSAQPAQQGRAIYELQATQSGKAVNREKIPFQVKEQPKPRILVLAAFPDFEYKFLRNWLFENQYPALIRVRVSKDKFSSEQLNFDKPESPVLTAESFKKFDLIIADEEELASLGLLEAALRRSVVAGTGLVLRLSDAKASSAFGKEFSISQRMDSITKSVRPVLDREKRSLSTLPVHQPLYLDAQAAKLSLLKDPKGNVLASSSLKGRGRVTATTLPATFNWMMNGAKADYAAYWSEVITQTSRKAEGNFFWNITPTFPRVSEQLEINFQHNISAGLPALKVNDEAIAVQQHLILPFYWQGRYRPQKTGWNTFLVENYGVQSLYVFAKNDWKAVKANELVQLNVSFSENQHLDDGKGLKEVQIIEKNVSKWIFVVLFLLSAGFLWFETKILH